MDSPETPSRPAYLGPFVIALAALAISLVTSIWSITESRAARGNSDDTASLVKSAIGRVSGPDAFSTGAPSDTYQPGSKLLGASASVSATGIVTKYAGQKPKVSATGLGALENLLGPVLPSEMTAEGLWCLSGGAWSIKNVSTKATVTAGKVFTDSSHETCPNGVFVATVSNDMGSQAKAFSINIAWVAKS